MVHENERLEHAYIPRGTFRNFSGAVSEFNKAGVRKFSILLPDEVAQEMEEIGWYIRHRPSRNEEDGTMNILDIEASYDTKDGRFQPPIVKVISWDGAETLLKEETIGVLDHMDIEDATVEIRPYNWEVNGKSGCKAYLQQMDVYARKPRRALNASMRRNEDDEEDVF